jgi:UDP-glucose 4-epimerase
MNILVIGSKGFIGTHLYDYFKFKENIVCYGCDIKEDNFDKNYFKLFDIKIDFEILFSSNQFDVCINCSGAANVQDSLIHTLNDFELNVFNVILILDTIKKYNPDCKFINLSSAAVYGNPSFLPMIESSKIQPVSPYGIHKSISELLCFEYYKYFGIKTISLRIFSAYGPGLKKQIFWDWYCKSLKSDIVLLLGNGSESRDYIFIDDLVSVIDLAIFNAEFMGNSFNVANGNEIFIKEIAEIFFNYLKKDYLFIDDSNLSDPLNWCANIEEIQKWGYIQKVSINSGIINYIEWARGLN